MSAKGAEHACIDTSQVRGELCSSDVVLEMEHGGC